ncbi:MAG TPA: hypothetical protein VIT20_05030 [Propionibacteriaceae bacterium]
MLPAPVPGTPRWAFIAAWSTVACVVPSGLWRTAVGLGAPLGWSAEHLALERIPGFGTAYVIGLSLGSLLASALTLGLVYRWGERFPDWVPGLGGRQLPVVPVVVVALLGALVVALICVLSIVNWDSVSGFADRPDSGWARLMMACYLPALLWAPLLAAVTVVYARRRGRGTRRDERH